LRDKLEQGGSGHADTQFADISFAGAYCGLDGGARLVQNEAGLAKKGLPGLCQLDLSSGPME